LYQVQWTGDVKGVPERRVVYWPLQAASFTAKGNRHVAGIFS
jgi:hypothetical protein